ncbi:LOW QUALITY PROTEIN: hypothetical protein CVT26_008414 [Gymnopilus dilepis]|uniref:Uncharacterized protein n=1 Tax=Gymnopilus dilepis TaxID=231916 RepID=A0A409WNU3_9AGAR|nr:LOW QUALITY PROTEIN: hypothetical protein CVT26_008414 [Gymnopilus dilepis]
MLVSLRVSESVSRRRASRLAAVSAPTESDYHDQWPASYNLSNRTRLCIYFLVMSDWLSRGKYINRILSTNIDPGARVNVYLVLGPYANLSISEGRCKKWQLFQVLAAYGLTGALHLVLMLMVSSDVIMLVIRQEPYHESHIIVYALHLKDIRIGVYLMVLYFAQLALQGYVTPNAVMHITISTWMTYISLVALVAVKRNLMSLGAPVVKRVMMDGGLSLMLLFCTYFDRRFKNRASATSIAMVCYSLARHAAQAHVIFGWPNTITSVAVSYPYHASIFNAECTQSCLVLIIMNMETLDYADCQSGSEEDRTLAQLEFERRAQIALAAETTQPA